VRITLVYPDYAPSKTLAAPADYGFYSEGISSLAAVLEEAGHAVSLLHFIAAPSREEFTERFRATAPDLAGFSVRTTIWPEVSRLAAYIKDVSRVPVVCGGVHATLAPEEIAASAAVDVVVVGEGEYPLAELAATLERGTTFDGIANLWVRRNGDWRRNAVRPLVEDLDTLPLPSYSVYDPAILYDIAIDTGPVMLSRGCPYQCYYCCNHRLQKAYPNRKHYARFRSPARSIEYIQHLRATYPNIRYLNIMDNILPLDRDWFLEFARLYQDQVGLPYACRHRHNLVTREGIEVLKASGCYLIHFGLESGNEDIRRGVINRQMSNEQVVRAHDLCREVGIATLTYNMVGLPRETKARFLDTVKLNARVRPNRIVLSVFYPYPRTVLHDLAEQDGVLATEFDYESESYLTQPQFPVEQVRFCWAYFVPAIRFYQLLAKLGFVGQGIGRCADAIYRWPYLPHRLLVAFALSVRAAFNGGKLFLRRRLPRLYTFVRDARVRRA
jgi:anaerobic magnesium-protoporphyrin IX monomethyl ester cyclase